MIIDVAIEEDPGHRSVEVDGFMHEGSPETPTSPREPGWFEVTSASWADEDPLDGEGDVDLFVDEHIEEISEAGKEEEQARYDARWSSHPDV